MFSVQDCRTSGLDPTVGSPYRTEACHAIGLAHTKPVVRFFVALAKQYFDTMLLCVCLCLSSTYTFRKMLALLQCSTDYSCSTPSFQGKLTQLNLQSKSISETRPISGTMGSYPSRTMDTTQRSPISEQNFSRMSQLEKGPEQSPIQPAMTHTTTPDQQHSGSDGTSSKLYRSVNHPKTPYVSARFELDDTISPISLSPDVDQSFHAEQRFDSDSEDEDEDTASNASTPPPSPDLALSNWGRFAGGPVRLELQSTIASNLAQRRALNRELVWAANIGLQTPSDMGPPICGCKGQICPQTTFNVGDLTPLVLPSPAILSGNHVEIGNGWEYVNAQEMMHNTESDLSFGAVSAYK